MGKVYTLGWRHMSVEASHFIGHYLVCSKAYPGWQQRDHQISALLAFCAENPSVTDRLLAQMNNNSENESTSSCSQKYKLGGEMIVRVKEKRRGQKRGINVFVKQAKPWSGNLYVCWPSRKPYLRWKLPSIRVLSLYKFTFEAINKISPKNTFYKQEFLLGPQIHYIDTSKTWTR